MASMVAWGFLLVHVPWSACRVRGTQAASKIGSYPVYARPQKPVGIAAKKKERERGEA